MSMTTPAAGLPGREADVALRDGTTVRVRPAGPSDAPGMERLLRGLSEESRYLRFFSSAVDLPRMVAWATQVDHQRRDGLVATTGTEGRILAHAGWEREGQRSERAEVALVIDDAFQGRGLGTLLLGQLAESARAQGVELFTAEVLPGNYQMVQVFRDSGFAVRIRSEPGVVMVEAPTLLTPDALGRFDQREEMAAAAALRRVLAPRSVAVIGASRQRGTVGGELFHNLLAAGFAGPVYPVNPNATVVQSVAAYPTVRKIPDPVDLAVLAVPADKVVSVARECAAKDVRALVVLSAGFAESGPHGVERQQALLEVCRQAGMRLVGPNCLGVINPNPAVLLYPESFANPRKFARFARRLARAKPIIAVKAGRSVAGARATSSHTGALLAASDVGVDALFRQAGVIRTDTLSELFDVAKLLATQPAPRGRRVAVVTNAGGPGILCADALEAAGLEVPALSEELRARLAEVLPAEAAAGNPVDLLAAAPPERYQHAIELMAGADEVDAVIVIHIPPLVSEHGIEQIAAAIRQAAERFPDEVALLAVLMTSGDAPAQLHAGPRPMPRYQFPEEAARALAHAVERGEWLRRPEGHLPELAGIRHDEAAALLAAALAGGPRWLTVEESAHLLACYGLPLADWRLGGTPQQAGALAAELGGRVALKAVVPGLLHKTESGAVRLDLQGRQAVTQEATDLADALAATGHPPEGFLVQRMATGIAELLVGVVHDVTFGPVVALGAGGTSAEIGRA